MGIEARKLAKVVAGTASILLIPPIGEFATFPNWISQQPSISLTTRSIASANTPPASTFQYNPPERGTPKSTEGTGSRGCPQSTPLTLSLLVPNDHTGQTTSGHPTFFWYVSDKPSAPLEFTLVEPGVAQPLFVKQIQVEKAGIVQVELPENLPELSTGRKYRWAVSLICNSKRPSNNFFVQSWIKRVAAKPEITQKLTSVNSEKERAEIYAAAGLWYDALTAISAAYNANPSDRAISEARLSLLDQVGLNPVVVQEKKNLSR